MKKIFSQSQKILSRRHKKFISCDSKILFLRSRKDIRKNNILAILFCSPDASNNFLGRKNTFSIFLVRKKCFFVSQKISRDRENVFLQLRNYFLLLREISFGCSQKISRSREKFPRPQEIILFNCEKKLAVAKNDISLSQKIFANMKNCFLRSS